MTWTEVLKPIIESEEYKTLWEKVKLSYSLSKCFPPEENIFRAFELTQFNDIKVVIVGQDPYHNDYQANGLCFSVSENVVAPPSLKNIFKELKNDIGIERKKKDLQDWANQGVLLLNSTLTVDAHKPNSHEKIGWDFFTDNIIKKVSDNKDNLAFVLWGTFAQKKKQLIDVKKHLIIESTHPSPLSAYKGFLGSCPFSKINNHLKNVGQETIVWG